MSCLKEHTSILWFGQKTQSVTKGKGVKPGCPFSPRLFTIVLDDILRTLEKIGHPPSVNPPNAIRQIVPYRISVNIFKNCTTSRAKTEVSAAVVRARRLPAACDKMAASDFRLPETRAGGRRSSHPMNYDWG
ncbi:hypothetical protein EVAR_82684_1 [Eumeta japonica]|uniref:Reverse transcriptase domain-containing protein n=1 Tax=Eumeta variegata TaxID=151549 RepID=A0A4C1VAX8_EUMVA|nr:hypothetical protein EVAR_82684_1 [Eumeta japonica]